MVEDLRALLFGRTRLGNLANKNLRRGCGPTGLGGSPPRGSYADIKVFQGTEPESFRATPRLQLSAWRPVINNRRVSPPGRSLGLVLIITLKIDRIDNAALAAGWAGLGDQKFYLPAR